MKDLLIVLLFQGGFIGFIFVGGLLLNAIWPQTDHRDTIALWVIAVVIFGVPYGFIVPRVIDKYK